MQTIEELKKERAKYKPGTKDYVRISNKIHATNKKLGIKTETFVKQKDDPNMFTGSHVKAVSYIFDRAKTLYLEGHKKDALVLLEILK